MCSLYVTFAGWQSGFPARYELVFPAAGVILFSLFVGVIMLPLLLQHPEVADRATVERGAYARAATAEVATLSPFRKWKSCPAADTRRNIDNQRCLLEVRSRVIGNLRRRAPMGET